MKLVKLAAGVLNQTPLDWDVNRRNISSCINEAVERDVSLLCLPELSITGYGCEDAFHSPGVIQTAYDVLTDLVQETQGIAVSFGLPLMVDGSLFNAACLVVDQQIAGFVAKKHLAGDGIHYEPRWFKPWPAGVLATYRAQGREFPLGDFFFDVNGLRIGFEICEDAWVGERPGAELCKSGVDIILNPSASHFAFGKHSIRERFVLEGSRAFQVSYVYANLLGNEAGRAIYDGDAMIASRGKLIASGPRFSYRDFLITEAVIDVEMTRMERSRISSYRPDPAKSDRARVAFKAQVPNPRNRELDLSEASVSTVELSKQEEFTRAVSLGLFDYVRKSASQGVVVSLSGGADSAAVAMLSRIMLEFASRELGIDQLRSKLGVTSADQVTGDLDEMSRQFITTVYQATRNSSEVTRAAARSVAERVHSEHFELDVDALVQGYVERIEEVIGRKLTWERDDITLQNIQARTRSPGIWMIANLRNSLLLSTSNRSEAAVGYATMDGDTSGGLSPIAGIDKAFLREWLRWMENEGPQGIGPSAQLSAVNDQHPTAELRPPASSQTDESDLMPYEVLDAIERWAIRDKRTPQEVSRLLAQAYPSTEEAIRWQWIQRFFQLWSRNQWKRERYAPSFHLDDENLDPKTWCRFPILSGGFRWELAELEKSLRKPD